MVLPVAPNEEGWVSVPPEEISSSAEELPLVASAEDPLALVSDTNPSSSGATRETTGTCGNGGGFPALDAAHSKENALSDDDGADETVPMPFDSNDIETITPTTIDDETANYFRCNIWGLHACLIILELVLAVQIYRYFNNEKPTNY